MLRTHTLVALALTLLMSTGCAVADATEDPGTDEEVGESESRLVESEERSCPVIIPKRNSACSEAWVGCGYLSPKGRSIAMYCDGAKWIYTRER